MGAGGVYSVGMIGHIAPLLNQHEARIRLGMACLQTMQGMGPMGFEADKAFAAEKQALELVSAYFTSADMSCIVV